MTRNLCCLVLTCLVTACAPKKAVEVVEAAVTPPKRNNNTSKPAVANTDTPQPEMPRVVNQEGMVVPDNIVNRLPDRNDMTPTAPPAPTGGGVIATPPEPRKPVNE
jgi:hypothetical protein